MKKTIIMALMAVASVSASAQQKQTIEIPSWLSNVKLSGYGMTQYQYSGQKDIIVICFFCNVGLGMNAL